MGPRTDPTVVAQTTVLRSRPRRSGAERSVAAYRLWLFAAVVPPKQSGPHEQEGEAGDAAGDDRQGRPRDADRIAKGEAGTPTTTIHHAGQEHGDDGRAEDGAGLRKTGEILTARDGFGQEGVDRDGGTDAEAPEDLGRDER
ncbi:MAG: hypothetical protein V9F04_10680 [Dermatophilaceae bacterium]